MKQTLRGETILLLDGAAQLGYAAWSGFRFQTRRSRGLIITSHHGGRLPTVWACRTSVSLLAGITAELLRSDPCRLRRVSEVLYQKHGGNLREALREWYDVYAEAETVASLGVS